MEESSVNNCFQQRWANVPFNSIDCLTDMSMSVSQSVIFSCLVNSALNGFAFELLRANIYSDKVH
ncbi:CLUMA_CG002434, isoform A [Clunio marinus]|uniref:CLUMA_CG002434, isoform A n=1 Tax=Clunio marinus TaxID=568069 RepID=A0A1J1HM01_9DIPT|nr:CLUMA_CG002434, isoform A [Clunio marinus]